MWQKSDGRHDDDVAQSQELDDGGLLTLEDTRSMARNARKRKVDISRSSRPIRMKF